MFKVPFSIFFMLGSKKSYCPYILQKNIYGFLALEN